MQGLGGPSGGQGPVGTVNRRTPYRDFTFDYGRAQIRTSDAGTASEIASYMADNSSLRIGIDGAVVPGNGQLDERRASAVRRALMRAGVPADRITLGAFDDPRDRRDGRVGVLLISSNS